MMGSPRMRSNALWRFSPRSRAKTRIYHLSAGWNSASAYNLVDIMVDGEQIYGDEVNVDGAKTPPLFSNATAIQKRLLAKPQA